MTVSDPPRPPSQGPEARGSRSLDREEIEALVEALIEEARQETRRRHRRYWAVAALVAVVGVVVLVLLDRGAGSQTASPALSARLNVGAQAGTSRIAFTGRADGVQTYSAVLYVMNADGSGKQKVADAGDATPSWSPDGRKIAFGGAKAATLGGLRVVNADGSGLRRLTMGNRPAWSPDGRRIAFTRSEPSRSGASYLVYVINADGSGERKLTSAGNGGRPVWSPDGRRIAFVTSRAGSSELYVMNADGSGKLKLADAGDATPAWSPDGRQLAYVRGYEIWVMNANGSRERRLTSGAGRDLAPSWSQDGQKIAFERRLGRRKVGKCRLCARASIFEVWVVNADGSGQQRLTRSGAQPRWSPDARRIAFVSSRDGNPEIYVMNADGSGQRNLTRTRGWAENWLAWSP